MATGNRTVGGGGIEERAKATYRKQSGSGSGRGYGPMTNRRTLLDDSKGITTHHFLCIYVAEVDRDYQYFYQSFCFKKNKYSSIYEINHAEVLSVICIFRILAF